MAGAVHGWGGVVLRISGQVIQAYFSEMVAHQIEAIEHTKGEEIKTASSIWAMEQIAIKKILYNIAKANEDLGEQNYVGAAYHFASAALWGALAASPVVAMAASAGAFGGFGGGGGGGGGGGYGSGSETAAGYGGKGTMPVPAGGPRGTSTVYNIVHVDGSVIGAHDLATFVNQLNAGQQRGNYQIISGSTLSTPIRRS